MIAPPRSAAANAGLPALRGAIRTSILSLVTLTVLAAAVIIVLFRSLGPPDSSLHSAMPTASTASPRASAPAGAEIRGTVTITPELAGRLRDGDVLFVIARKGPGAPFAVQRILAPRFPLAYRLGPDDVMLAGSPFEGEVRMSVRLSRSGSAGPTQTGDLEGEYPGPVKVGAANVDMAISRAR